MRISDLSQREIGRRLRGKGLRLRIGPFAVNLNSSLKPVARQMVLLYSNYPLVEYDGFIDFHIHIDKPRGLRHWIRPQAIFSFDGLKPFKPLPADQAFAMFEWGLNWCIATHAHQYLITHAAVVAKNDRAIIFPGEPGAGKSTLCAALVHQGWRLLSDEMALISPTDLHLTPIPRPIGLKNESIPIVQGFGEDTVVGRPVTDTAKGTVAHMRPPDKSVDHCDTHANPTVVIFPTYSATADTVMEAVEKAAALTRMAEQSFNYHILGADGFRALERLVSRCGVFDMGYSDLDAAVSRIEALIDEAS